MSLSLDQGQKTKLIFKNDEIKMLIVTLSNILLYKHLKYIIEIIL